MFEINLLSIWIPIAISIIIIIVGRVFPGGGGDYSFEGCFILAGVVILILLIWLVWFILKFIFQ